jgi:hypothetical protein
MKRLNFDYLSYLLFFLISVLVLWDLLASGFVLSLDMIFAENMGKNIFKGLEPTPLAGIFLNTLISFLDLFLPMWIVQKVIMFSIIFFSGIFAYISCPSENKIGKFFAGLIYMINPFIFVRFLAGHLLLLIGYTFLPLLIREFMNYFEEINFKNLIKISVLLSLVSISPHFIPVIFGIFFLFLMIKLIKTHHWDLIKYSFLILILYSLLNLYWLYPLISNFNENLASFENFIGPKDISLFSPKPSFDFNTLFNLASMHGFWRGGYDYAKFHTPFWYILYIVILFLSVHGFIKLDKYEGKSIYLKLLSLIAIISLIFSTGLTHPVFSKIFSLFFENIPFFKGYREPHKLVSILCLTYSLLGGIGLGDLVNQFKLSSGLTRVLLIFFIILAFLTPFIYSYTMFFGFNNQLEVKDYPDTWYRVNDYLVNDKEDFKVLFLPWHMYMDFRFNPKQRISNPADRFFSKPVIQGDNIEAGGIYSQSNNPLSKYIEFLLTNNRRYDNLGELLTPLNIKYIILAKETDWKLYMFLYNQTDLELVIDNKDLLVFKNSQDTSLMYETDFILTRDSWEELIEGNQTLSLEPIKSEKMSSVKFVVETEPEKTYLVFAEVFAADWRYDNQNPEPYLGIVNIFNSSSEKKLYYSKFKYYILAYIISGVTLLFFLGYLIFFRRRSD